MWSLQDPLDPLPLTHGQAPNHSLRTRFTARLTRSPLQLRVLLRRWGAVCERAEPLHIPPVGGGGRGICRPVVSSEVPAWGALSAITNSYPARGRPQDTVKVPDGCPRRSAAGGASKQMQRRAVSSGTEAAQALRRLSPAQGWRGGGCPLLSGHRRWASGPSL